MVPAPSATSLLPAENEASSTSPSMPSTSTASTSSTSSLLENPFYKMQADGLLYKHPNEIIDKVVSRIRPNSVVLQVVDLLDFEASLCPELYIACRNKQCSVLFVVNKIDCLPAKANLPRIKMWVRNMARQVKNVHIANVVLLSAANETGFAELEARLKTYIADLDRDHGSRVKTTSSAASAFNATQQHVKKYELLEEGTGSSTSSNSTSSTSTPLGHEKKLDPNQDRRFIYVTGRVNAGKSTFVERFLRYIGYKHLPSIDWKRGAGGITRAPVPGTTANFLSFSLPRNFRLIDTPGIPSTHQVTSKLRTCEDLYDVVPRARLHPLTYALKQGRSLLIGSLCRIDHVGGTFGFVTSFFSNRVTLHVCNTAKANDTLARKAGTFFYPPHKKEDFEALDLVSHKVQVFGSNHRAWDDIVIAGLGWISVAGFGSKEFQVWVPKGVKVFRRPAMMPYELCVNGVTRFSHRLRARGSAVGRKKRKMVRLLRDRDKKYALRDELAQKEEDRKGTVVHGDTYENENQGVKNEVVDVAYRSEEDEEGQHLQTSHIGKLQAFEDAADEGDDLFDHDEGRLIEVDL
ncbi:unnamed protein product [Amoebophrya sp. A25]|nr:unnamed protein product [Amoebophrya sp. A25]|eukprot:GSA25T00024232001.1